MEFELCPNCFQIVLLYEADEREIEFGLRNWLGDVPFHIRYVNQYQGYEDCDVMVLALPPEVATIIWLRYDNEGLKSALFEHFQDEWIDIYD